MSIIETIRERIDMAGSLSAPLDRLCLSRTEAKLLASEIIEYEFIPGDKRQSVFDMLRTGEVEEGMIFMGIPLSNDAVMH